MSKEKKVLMNIDTVRIIEHDPMNVVVERLEQVINPQTKEATDKWAFKGYFSSIVSALQSITKNELLIDKNAVSDLETYLKQIEASNEEIMKALQGTKL